MRQGVENGVTISDFRIFDPQKFRKFLIGILHRIYTLVTPGRKYDPCYQSHKMSYRSCSPDRGLSNDIENKFIRPLALTYNRDEENAQKSTFLGIFNIF